MNGTSKNSFSFSRFFYKSFKYLHLHNESPLNICIFLKNSFFKVFVINFFFLMSFFSLFGENLDTFSYSNISSVGLVTANKDSWYLEENDILGRPIKGTWWSLGKIVKTSEWVYDGKLERAIRRIDIENGEKTVIEYDSSSNILSEARYTTKGDRVFFQEFKKENGKLISEYLFFKEGEFFTVYSYNADTIREKRTEKNGVLISLCEYEDEDTWIEKIYKNGKVILSTSWKDGVKLGKTEATK